MVGFSVLFHFSRRCLITTWLGGLDSSGLVTDSRFTSLLIVGQMRALRFETVIFEGIRDPHAVLHPFFAPIWAIVGWIGRRPVLFTHLSLAGIPPLDFCR